MAKRMISVRVDEDILEAFDEVAWRRKLSRTALLEQLMAEAAERSLEFGEPHGRRPIAEMHEQGVPGGCVHPKDKRVTFAWGSKCGVCNSIVR